MRADSSGRGIAAFGGGRQSLLGIGLALLGFGGFGAGVPALAESRAVSRLCASGERLSFSVEHQKSVRVCGTIPVRISIWNRSEERKSVLDRLVIRSASGKDGREIRVGKELPPAAADLDRFCAECAAGPNCGDVEGCGELYASLRSKGEDLELDIPLGAGQEGAGGASSCAGESVDVEAHLVVGDEPVVLRRTLAVKEYPAPVPTSVGEVAAAGDGTIYLVGALPHPPGWYAGDQHSHTSWEKDSGLCIWEWPDSMASMIGAARAMDLNWQIFTDHSFGLDATLWNGGYNECAAYNAAHPTDAYRCLYGEEVSTGNRSGQFSISHYLELPRSSDLVGFYGDGCSFLCASCRAEQTVINDINTLGGMGIIAHPYDADFSWANWSVTGYTGIEILNSIDGAWGTEDESAFTQWANLLAGGANVVGLSDSDAHYAADVGHTFTYCRLPAMSTAGVRSAIAEGRCVFGNGPLAYVEIGAATIGDTLAACPGAAAVSIHAFRGDAAMGFLDRIGIYVNGLLRDEIVVAGDLTEYHGTRQLDLASGDRYLYLRVLNRGAAKTHKAWTNPLWLSISPENGPDADGDTYTTCENDCDDGNASVHPGAPELCDFADNDCDGATDEGYAVPAGTTGLVVESNKQTMSWDAVLQADRYDVVKGDVAALRSSGGDFASSLVGCLENDSVDARSDDSLAPAPGEGFYYLVRAQAACKSGTFNSEPPGQSGDRDPEIASSPSACP